MPVREAVTVRSYCRICTAQCGILVDVEDQQVVRVRGDKAHPVTHGYTCPKGRALGQLHHHPQRLERPLMKVDGILQPTSWGRCLDDLGAKLREVIDQHGPAAVGMFFGSGVGMDAAGYRTAEALQAAIGTPAKFSPLTIDGTAKTLVGSLVGGFPGFSARPDYERVRLVVYIGINPIVSHGHTVAMPDPARIVRRLAKNGEVWVIDPRFTETAKYASRHVAPKPGMDYAILAYLLRESLSAGANPDNTVDGDVLRKVVEPFDRARAAEIAGVSERDLADLLNAVRKAGRLAVETGTGVTMSAGANLTQWLGWALMIITDSMNRPGGVWFHPGFVRRLDAAPLPLITAPFGAGPSSRPELRGMVGDWPCAALPDEINAGHIRAFLNLGGAMMRSFPDSNRLGQALQRLEVFATLDIIETENTRLSTHVLPTKDQLERPDVTLWDFLSPRVNAQYTPAAIEPVGERRSTWWVLAELMQRLGHTPPFPIPDDDRAHGADDAVLANFLASGRCSFVELANTGYHEVEHEIPARWVDAHIERLGGWRLAPAELVDQLTQLTQQAVQERSGSLMLVPRRQKRHLNAALLFLGDRPEVFLNPADAASIGVEDGQQCRVSTNRGELVGVVRIDTGMRVGVVSVPHGHEHANINWLTDVQAVDTITGMARYSGFPVSVHPVGARAPAPAEHT